MQEYTSPSERLKALTDQLEQGVSDIFQSGQYAAYLTAMSKFHHYSFGNTMLIFMPPMLRVITIGEGILADRSSEASVASPYSPPALTEGKKKWRKLPRTVLPVNQSSGCSA